MVVRVWTYLYYGQCCNYEGATCLDLLLIAAPHALQRIWRYCLVSRTCSTINYLWRRCLRQTALSLIIYTLLMTCPSRPTGLLTLLKSLQQDILAIMQWINKLFTHPAEPIQNYLSISNTIEDRVSSVKPWYVFIPHVTNTNRSRWYINKKRRCLL